MILTGWHVDGFGTLSGEHAEGLGPGACIVFGPNEAGKSTLLAFLRFVLFGAAGSRAAQALRGGRPGGRVFLRDEGGRVWTAERHADVRGAAAAVLDPDGQPAPADALGRLLGGADAALFGSVFAFSLAELSRFDSLGEASVRDRILSAGITGAGTTASQARRTLEAGLAALLRPRSAQARLNRLVQELRASQAALAAAQQQAASYQRLVAEERGAAAQVEALGAEVAGLAREDRVLETLGGLWEPWNRWRTAREELAALPERPVPRDGRGRMAEVRRRDAAARERLRGAAGQVEVEARELERLRCGLRPEVEAVADRVRAVAAGLAAQRAALERLAACRPRGEELRHRLRQRLEAVGPGWDEERLAAFDLSAPAADRVQGWAQRLSEAESRAAQAREAAEQAAGDLSRGRREAAAAAEAASQAADLPDRREVDARRERLEAIERRLPWLRAAPGRLAVLAAASLGLAAFGAHEGGAAGWATAAAGIAALLLTLRTLGSGWAAERRAVREAAAALDLPPSPLPSPRALDAVRSRLRRDEEAARRRAEVEDGLRSAEDEVRRLTARHEDLGAAATAESARVAAIRREWEVWAHDAGFPDGLSPAGAGAFGDALRAAREAARDLASAAGEEAALDGQVAAWRAQATGALEAASRTAAEGDDALATLVEGLDAEVAAALEVRRQEGERSRRLAELEPQAETARQEAARVGAEHQALLQEAGADDDAAYDRLLEEAEARAAREREAHTLWSAIAAQLGEGAYADELRQRLQGGDPAAWLSRRAAVQQRLAAAGEEREAAIAARGEAERRRRDLEASADVAAAAAREEGVRAELAAAVQQWRRLRLAVHLIDTTLAGFIRNRQPEVLAIASGAFSAVTAGRFARVVQDPLAAESLAVVDGSGARLAPPQLSRGTAEQLYLSLRLGLAESFARRTTALPLILDDVLVNFDPERAESVMRAFARYLAGPGRQVLLFTCHPETRDMALRLCGPCPVVTLAPPEAPGRAAAEAAAAVETAGMETAGMETAGTETAGMETTGTETAGMERTGTETAGTGAPGPWWDGAAVGGASPDGAAAMPDGASASGRASASTGAAAMPDGAAASSRAAAPTPSDGAVRAPSAAAAPSVAPAEAAALVLERFAARGHVTPRDVRLAFGWGPSSVARALRDLVARGLARREGTGRSSRYLLG